MTMIFNRLLRQVFLPLTLGAVLGCSKTETEEVHPATLDRSKLVPVTGTVTLKGKPLAGAVVTFLPKTGVPGLGETDSEGKYSLKSALLSGVTPGEYKVAISYLVSAGGEPQGVGARSAMVQSPEMMSAKEQLPAEYSDLGRTKLQAGVQPAGGNFNFDIPATLEIPAPKSAGKDGEKPAASTKKGEKPAEANAGKKE